MPCQNCISAWDCVSIVSKHAKQAEYPDNEESEHGSVYVVSTWAFGQSKRASEDRGRYRGNGSRAWSKVYSGYRWDAEWRGSEATARGGRCFA